MGRPKKFGDAALDRDIRIPVTVQQKETIARAVALEGQDLAVWARTILLRAAEERIVRQEPDRSRRPRRAEKGS